MQTQLVHRESNKVFTDSLIVAKGCDNRSHESTIKLIRKYQSDFEEFGTLGFRIQKSGGKETTYCDLTEDQATLLITYFRNTPSVRKFKIKLVKAFREALNEINRIYADPPRTGLIRVKRDVHKDMMNALVEHRDDLGKETDAKHFMCENKLCNGVVTGKYAKCNESELSNSDLELLALVRKRNEAFLMAGIDYQDRKKRLIAFAMKHRTKLISSL
jgi:phage regulator Rha-like protein